MMVHRGMIPSICMMMDCFPSERPPAVLILCVAPRTLMLVMGSHHLMTQTHLGRAPLRRLLGKLHGGDQIFGMSPLEAPLILARPPEVRIILVRPPKVRIILARPRKVRIILARPPKVRIILVRTLAVPLIGARPRGVAQTPGERHQGELLINGARPQGEVQTVGTRHQGEARTPGGRHQEEVLITGAHFSGIISVMVGQFYLRIFWSPQVFGA